MREGHEGGEKAGGRGEKGDAGLPLPGKLSWAAESVTSIAETESEPGSSTT